MLPRPGAFARATCVALVLAACGHPSSSTDGQPAPALLAIRFDNASGGLVTVYLVGEERQWLLGRVEPGSVATLRLPEGSRVWYSTSLQLTVLPERMSQQAAAEPRSWSTTPRPLSALLASEWRFAQGQITGVAPHRR